MINRFLIIILLITFSAATHAERLPVTVKELRLELEVINFDLEKDAKLNRLATLVAHTEELAKENNNDPGILLMAGVYNAQYAGAIGGIGALKYAKAARGYLESSVKLDPTIYSASAYSVLGTLYLRVPRWPIGYGSKKKADENYKMALEIAPNDIDLNFTYARYLYQKKKYAESKIYLQQAKVAPPRPLLPRADRELHRKIDQALIAIDKKLKQ